MFTHDEEKNVQTEEEQKLIPENPFKNDDLHLILLEIHERLTALEEK